MPLSAQSSGKSRQQWPRTVAEAAAKEWRDTPTDSRPLKAVILYCSNSPSDLDADNIAKPILDALKQVVYEDDRQIRQVLIRIWENIASARMERPSKVLLRALKVIHKYRDFVYVRMSDQLDLSEMPQ